MGDVNRKLGGLIRNEHDLVIKFQDDSELLIQKNNHI